MTKIIGKIVLACLLVFTIVSYAEPLAGKAEQDGKPARSTQTPDPDFPYLYIRLHRQALDDLNSAIGLGMSPVVDGASKAIYKTKRLTDKLVHKT